MTYTMLHHIRDKLVAQNAKALGQYGLCTLLDPISGHRCAIGHCIKEEITPAMDEGDTWNIIKKLTDNEAQQNVLDTARVIHDGNEVSTWPELYQRLIDQHSHLFPEYTP